MIGHPSRQEGCSLRITRYASQEACVLYPILYTHNCNDNNNNNNDNDNDNDNGKSFIDATKIYSVKIARFSLFA